MMTKEERKKKRQKKKERIYININFLYMKCGLSKCFQQASLPFR